MRAINGWRQVLLWPFGLLVRLWGMSLRFEASPDDLRHWTKKDEPVAIILWHNRLFLAAEIVRRYRQGRPAYALVSASQDGAWLTAFFALAGLHIVRGSSSRLGREAAMALVDVLRSGDDVGITPDGPRGPRRQAAPGMAQLAALAQVPILPCAIRTSRRIALNSWDRMAIPLPFGRGVVVCGPTISVPREAWRDSLPLIAAAMNAAADRADRLCADPVL